MTQLNIIFKQRQNKTFLQPFKHKLSITNPKEPVKCNSCSQKRFPMDYCGVTY